MKRTLKFTATILLAIAILVSTFAIVAHAQESTTTITADQQRISAYEKAAEYAKCLPYIEIREPEYLFTAGITSWTYKSTGDINRYEVALDIVYPDHRYTFGQTENCKVVNGKGLTEWLKNQKNPDPMLLTQNCYDLFVSKYAIQSDKHYVIQHVIITITNYEDAKSMSHWVTF